MTVDRATVHRSETVKSGSLQAWSVAVGVEAEPVELVACQRPVCREPWHEVGGVLAEEAFAQYRIVGPQVPRFERWRLVAHAMCFERRKIVHYRLPQRTVANDCAR